MGVEPSTVALSTLLVAVGGYLVSRGWKAKGRTLFGIGAILGGYTCFSGIMPFFLDADHRVSWFLVLLGYAIVALGASVGGVIAFLLHNECLALASGTLASVFVLLLMDSSTPQGAGNPVALSAVGGVFLVFTVMGWVSARKFELWTHIVVTALIGTLLIIAAVDLPLEGAVVHDLGSILLGEWDQLGCKGGAGACRATIGGLTAWPFLAMASIIYQSWVSKQCCESRREGYTQLKPSGQSAGNLQKSYSAPKFEDIAPPFRDPAGFNMFNPLSVQNTVFDQLVQLVYMAGEELTEMFGFQTDNLRSQCEHLSLLIMNQDRYVRLAKMDATLGNADAVQYQIKNLHSRLFENYRQWCSELRLGENQKFRVAFQLTFDDAFTENQPALNQESIRYLYEMMLWLLIWGEAGNLRHMPECLCFLYHKMGKAVNVVQKKGQRLEKSRRMSVGGSQPTRRRVAKVNPPGTFLSETIKPIYEVISKKMPNPNLEHEDKPNYDDFNEFFWSPKCLAYSWRSGPPQLSLDDDLERGMGTNAPAQSKADSSEVKCIAEGLSAGQKTYLEKRNWLAIMLAFRRLIDWHLVTFQLLVIWAFSELLVWDLPWLLQIMSSVFMTVNILNLVWVMLEVWMTHPGLTRSDETVSGAILRLLGHFILLVYQGLFFSMSLQGDGLWVEPGAQLAWKKEQVYYWWQYLWVSLVMLSVWFIDLLMQIFPPLSSVLYSSDRNVFLRTLIRIIWPQSRNYTGKDVKESMGNVLTYSLFWGPLVAWKLYFSYNYEIMPNALPSLELSDDFLNYPGKSLTVTVILICSRWLPFLMIYMLDTLIWYSMWAGTTGLIVGLDEKLGEIRDFHGIRQSFMRTPEGFTTRLVHNRPDTPRLAETPRNAKNYGSLMPRVPSKLALGLGGNGSSTPRDTTPRESTPLLPRIVSGGSTGVDGRGQIDGSSSSNTKLTASDFQWEAFKEVWNEIILNLRTTDLLSNDERDMLLFHHFRVEGLNKQSYLPVFQTAGSVERAANIAEERVNAFRAAFAVDGANRGTLLRVHHQGLLDAVSTDLTMQEAVYETVELALWFLVKLLGEGHETTVNPWLWPEEGRLFKLLNIYDKNILLNFKIENVSKLIKSLSELVSTLKGQLGKRKINPNRQPRRKNTPPPVVVPAKGSLSKASSGMKKSLSASFLMVIPNEVQTGYEEEPEEIDSLRDKTRDHLRQVFTNLKGCIMESAKPESELAKLRTICEEVMSNPKGWQDDYYASNQLDNMTKDPTILQVLTKLHGLLNLHIADAEPSSGEARRRLTFFVNSLFMDMPTAPDLRRMMSWTVMTPYYSEDVLYSKKDLESANTDGVTTFLYLQTLYPKDWDNFLERMNLHNDPSKIWKKEFLMETRMWASMRAQTLARTVEGMMYYEKAIRQLAKLEVWTKTDDPEQRTRMAEELAEEVIPKKFGYVVACQVYGKMKKSQDSKADDIEWLLHRFPNLRVAYIDETRGFSTTTFSSVLIKSSPTRPGTIEEVYRVRLPGNPVVGEGKPENQNHAVIFSRGELVQAIDMNQDGYFEEAFKMRNLLYEFVDKNISPLEREKNIKKPNASNVPITILGFREHIFTGAVSSLANYMALQEFSFVTLGQRVLNRPLRMRLHYGHPDIFDKLFFMQRGGISKSSKGINLSEDIFAGYNNVLRGGAVQMKEYAQVGKGRDVGMQQIYKFEAKLSQGASEQSISRDVSRMLNRLDFLRLLSFYFGGIGHYLSSVLTIAAIWVMVYLMLGLAMFEQEKIGDRPIIPEGFLQLCLAGVGVLQTVPLLCTLVVERGISEALWEILQVFWSGGPLYFIFHIRTRDYYYSQTVLAGGATYRATGRGFVTHHSPFDENFRFFAASHFYLGFELVVALVLLAIYTDAGQYGGRTWSLWLAAASFLFAPFWFNPLSFEWSKVAEDYQGWLRWMTTTGGSAGNSWDTWWREENKYVEKLTVGSRLYLAVRSTIYLMVAAGVVYRPLFVSHSYDEAVFFIHALICLAVLTAANWLVDYLHNNQPSLVSYAMHRTIKIAILTILIFLFTGLTFHHPACFQYLLALYYTMSCLGTVAQVCGSKGVRVLHKVHDYVLGHFLFVPLFLFAALQIPGMIQSWLLYHNALSQGVVTKNLLNFARKLKTKDETDVAKAPVTPKPAAPASSAGAPESVALEMKMSPHHEETKLQEAPPKGHLPRRPSLTQNYSTPSLMNLAQQADGSSHHVEGLVFQQPSRLPPKQQEASSGSNAPPSSDFIFQSAPLKPPPK